MKILLINGSHRAGNTDIITSQVIKLLKKNQIETKELILRDIEMKLPDGCEACAESEYCPNIHDEFSEKIEPKIRNYDIYILASPTWDDGITPLTKIFWDRIVPWCHEDRMFLKDNKLAVITHGMAGKDSWINVINWVKSVCVWEEANFGGSLTIKSGGKVGDLRIFDSKIEIFIDNLIA